MEWRWTLGMHSWQECILVDLLLYEISKILFMFYKVAIVNKNVICTEFHFFA